MSHRIIIADAARSVMQNAEFRQECTQDELTILGQCLAAQEPSDEQMHRALRILGRKYACGD